MPADVLRYVSAAVETAVLEALTEDAQMTSEKAYLPYTRNLCVVDITAQEKLLKQWGLTRPGRSRSR